MCPGFGLDRSVPNALHKKALQRQIAVGTVVSSQQRRALAVPVINRLSTTCQPLVNRLSTACQPLVLCTTGFHRISFVRACEETFKTIFYGTVETFRDGRLRGRPNCRHPLLPSFAPPRFPPCTASTRPDPSVLCLGFGFDRFT